MRRFLLTASLALVLSPLVAVGPGAGALAQTQAAPSAGGDNFNLSSVDALLAKGDRDAASGNLTEAVKSYDKARNASRSLLSFYRDLGGAFRGLDARIPRDMDQKGRESIEKLAQANLRLAAVYRRQNQSEVAVPLLVEVVKLMTPSTGEGRKAYQQLVEIGFVSTPYTAPASPTSN
jgi:tetratricopeptide (TPR) repeat protein